MRDAVWNGGGHWADGARRLDSPLGSGRSLLPVAPHGPRVDRGVPRRAFVPGGGRVRGCLLLRSDPLGFLGGILSLLGDAPSCDWNQRHTHKIAGGMVCNWWSCSHFKYIMQNCYIALASYNFEFKNKTICEAIELEHCLNLQSFQAEERTSKLCSNRLMEISISNYMKFVVIHATNKILGVPLCYCQTGSFF